MKYIARFYIPLLLYSDMNYSEFTFDGDETILLEETSILHFVS